MSADQVENTLKSRLADFSGLGAKIKLVLDGTEVLLLDGTALPPTLVRASEADDSETTLRLSSELMLKLLDGSADPTMSFMTGKLKVDGSMGYALKLAGLLEG